MRSKLWKVTAHEFRMTAGTKAFIILTILGPFLIAAVSIVPSLLSTRVERRNTLIALPNCPEALYSKLAEELAPAGVQLTRAEDGDLDRKVLQGELYGYLQLPEDWLSARSLELVTRELADFRVMGALQSSLGRAIVGERLRAAGLESAVLQPLVEPPQLGNQQVTRGGAKVKGDIMATILLGVAFTMMLYMTILLYGQSIGRSVVQEKSSRTVEILLSSVDVRELLFGKILGQAAASLLQYAVWIGLGLLAARLLGPGLGLSSLPQLTGRLPLYLVAFFLLGFFLYAAVYAALGAAAEDEQNLAQLSWPVIVFLILPMVAAGGIATRPGSAFAVVLSLFPLTSPIVMFLRVLLSEPGWPQVTLAMGLTAATAAGFTLLSAKIFRVGILMTGRRFSWAQILRWLRS